MTLEKRFVLKIFEAFTIERWNDLVRPFEIIEMDKAGEKMVLAYIIGKIEEDNGRTVDWQWMIYASLFDLLKKIALCDIKSPVQHLIKTEFPDEYRKLNKWVIDQYRPLISDAGFFAQFSHYIEDALYPANEKQLLSARVFRAAHKFSTLRELQMIATVNEAQRLRKIERELNAGIQGYLDLRGVQLLLTRQRPFDFLLMIEQLRFQRRWNQTPRVPSTSVLGHCFFVAIITLLLSREMNVNMCSKRLFNNYFSGLFHDLPEAVTRDIISPVKQATNYLPQIVKMIEEQIVQKELIPLMEQCYKDELLYFTSDEFENRVIIDRKTHRVSWEEMNSSYNGDLFSPVDGALVRCADHLSALLEADSSIKYGITSEHLVCGRDNIMSLYPPGKIINGIDTGTFFANF